MKLARHRAAQAALLHLIGEQVHEEQGIAAPAPIALPKEEALPTHENPISWINEHAAKARLHAPTFDIANTGTAQAPKFTCRATYEAAPDFTAEATAASKAEAKTKAAETLRQRILAA
ncbi:hypothetical protein GCM10025867_50100 (plasmid) [Frondihabitans sucicola]|uniref:DRBM domain-containing protein n=1 Tax=Frondihabitans sucicola TaxID=1268041 RepID=A0ABM8GWB8_9MICO|nr:double-stranded RNA binding motif domain-containing protein [Frondihabitans sucicola]BDZ52769.1 hypothetical protein GCM10025867_50100 [Frondihabitans sucicola]